MIEGEMSSVFHQGHQRNRSQAQQLISNVYDEDGGQPSIASPYDADLVQSSSPDRPYRSSTKKQPQAATNPTNAMRFSTLSDCSSYYGLPGAQNEHETRYLCKNPYLRANKRVIVGSLALTLVGAALLIFGLCVMLLPNDMDVHGWIFLVVGVLFFIPGVYHIIYIFCVLCGRPGYSFDNLPTFSKPEV